MQCWPGRWGHRPGARKPAVADLACEASRALAAPRVAGLVVRVAIAGRSAVDGDVATKLGRRATPGGAVGRSTRVATDATTQIHCAATASITATGVVASIAHIDSCITLGVCY